MPAIVPGATRWKLPPARVVTLCAATAGPAGATVAVVRYRPPRPGPLRGAERELPGLGRHLGCLHLHLPAAPRGHRRRRLRVVGLVAPGGRSRSWSRPDPPPGPGVHR